MYTVLVLMSTYNGEKFLETQIESVLKQNNVEVDLLVRDDGSTDGTINILTKYANKGKLTWYTGDNLRPAKSFMNLLKKADDNYDFYAFCDQDDYWLPDKLSVAVKYLSLIGTAKPALYYGRTTLVDSDLNLLSGRAHSKNYNFTNFSQAVISSNATGCTMCFNLALKKTINLYEPKYQIMHDGWVHKVCLAIDGSVYYDKDSYILYRQHGNNVIGGTITPFEKWKRRMERLKEDPCPRSKGVNEIFIGYADMLSRDNKLICYNVAHYNDSLSKKLRLLLSRKIYSSNMRIDFMFRITVLLGIF